MAHGGEKSDPIWCWLRPAKRGKSEAFSSIHYPNLADQRSSMSSVDSRYFQLWAAKSSTSKANGAQNPCSSTSQPYRVDLNVPGGLTYAPSDEVAAHGVKRRLFLPRRGARDDEYDFGYEGAQEMRRKRAKDGAAQKSTMAETLQPACVLGQDGDLTTDKDSGRTTRSPQQNLHPLLKLDDFNLPKRSAAEEYAETIKQGSVQNTSAATSRDSAPVDAQRNTLETETAPFLALSNVRSIRSTMTATEWARSKGLLARNPKLDGSANVVAFKPPPSISGDTSCSVDPWNAPSLRGRSDFDRITEKERDRGLTKAEEYAGEGNVPSRSEVDQNAERDVHAHGDDAATLRTTATTQSACHKGQGTELRISDVFIPDPRPNRPLRLVRRTDPSQVLVICAGVALTSQEVSARKAVDAAFQQGITDYRTDQAKQLLASFGGDESGEIRAGLGVYFCPSTMLARHHLDENSDVSSPRFEENFSRRMERVTFPYTPSSVRAALRSVLAALEYLPFPQEGFNKVVVAVEHEWLLRGISADIHEWRRNDWRLVRSSCSLGQVGDTVADRDLWETLDAVVCKWEEVDVNVRFWNPPSNEELLAEARELAKLGACKENQQPHMVRWVKKRSS